MKRRVAALFLGLNVLGTVLQVRGEDAAPKQVRTVHTERVNFAPGGLIRLQDSFGTLTLEGWDRSEVEIKVIKSLERYYEPAEQEEAARRLEQVRVSMELREDGELAVSTVAPRRFFGRKLGADSLDKFTGILRHTLGGESGVMLEYKIHVPREARLVIRHGPGRVLVSAINGEIDVTSNSGYVVLMLPDSGAYSIDARSKFGVVSSDFEGAAHRRHLVGSEFAQPVQSPARRIYARTGAGSITIKAVPAEALVPK